MKKAKINGKEINAPYIKGESWRAAKSYPKYYISNKGRVYSLKSNKLLKLYKYSNYIYIELSHKGIKHKYRLHRLVALHFLNNPDNKPIVHHKDRNRNNNDVSNLMWCTQTEHKELHKELDKLKKGVRK